MKNIWLVGLVAMGGCASEPAKDCSKDGGAACFQLPTAPLAAYSSDGTPQVLALGCGGLSATGFEQTTTMSGVTRDPIANVIVPYAQAFVYGSTTLMDVIATTTSDATGTFSLSLPAGTPNVLSMRWSAPEYLPGTLLRHAFGATETILEVDPALVTVDDADVHAGLVRATYDRDAAVTVAIAHDCHDSRLQHAAISISSESGRRSFIDGVILVYTADDQIVPLLQSVQSDTSKQGAAAAINTPVGETLYVQAWGFPDDAALAKSEEGLVLVDELPLSVEQSGLVGVELYAR